MQCPDCNGMITIEELGEGECSTCGFATNIEWLVARLGPQEIPRKNQKLRTVPPANTLELLQAYLLEIAISACRVWSCTTTPTSAVGVISSLQEWTHQRIPTLPVVYFAKVYTVGNGTNKASSCEARAK